MKEKRNHLNANLTENSNINVHHILESYDSYNRNVKAFREIVSNRLFYE